MSGMRDDSNQGNRMRRLRRIIFNTLSILSLLLCVAMAGLWVRSYWIADAFSLVHSGGIDRPGDHGDLIAEFNMVWANGRVRYERYDTECFGGGDGGNVALPGPLWTLTHTSNTPHYAEIVEHSVWTTRQPTKWGAFVAGEEDYRGIHTISLMKYVAAPMWAVFMPLLLSSSLCARRILRPRRPPLGLCHRCGYDLRATPDRCPECGSVSAKSPGSSPAFRDV